MREEVKTQVIIKKVTDTKLPDDVVCCSKDNHFITTKQDVTDVFHNPIKKGEMLFFS